MAISSQSYTQVPVDNLKVVDNFKELMSVATGKDSAYILAKESLTEYFNREESSLSERERITALSDLIGNMATQITNSTLNASITIAKEDRDAVYTLTKLKQDTLMLQEQRDKLATDKALVEQNILNLTSDRDLKTIQGWKLQADMVRDNGFVPTSVDIGTTVLPTNSISKSGIKYEQEQQTKMSVYATLAKSFRESGVVSWTTSPTDGKINSVTDLAPATPGLTKAQEKVAIRQEIGFDDNKRQHAANSSAAMIGMILSNESTHLLTAEHVNLWTTSVGYLNTAANGSPNPVPGNIVVTTAITTLVRSTGITLVGTSTNMVAGSPIIMKITTGEDATLETSNIDAGMVGLDGTWSITATGASLSNLAIDSAAKISLYSIDSTGLMVTDETMSETINITG